MRLYITRNKHGEYVDDEGNKVLGREEVKVLGIRDEEGLLCVGKRACEMPNATIWKEGVEKKVFGVFAIEKETGKNGQALLMYPKLFELCGEVLRKTCVGDFTRATIKFIPVETEIDL